MPHITEMDSDNNKENQPPLDYDTLLYFDQKFPDYKEYRAYIENNLTDWLCDPDFRNLDAAYCHHRLTLGHIQALTAMAESLQKAIKQSQDLDNTQQDNFQKTMPNLVKNGAYKRIVKTLIKPPKPRNNSKKKGTCPKCRLPYISDHIAWCRGLDNGYTCRCHRKPLQPIPEEEPIPSSSTAVVLHSPRLKCFTCGSQTHLKPNCPHYHCRYCGKDAPGHWLRNCQFSPHRRLLTPKEEETNKWGNYSDGHYDIYGSE